MQTIDIGASQIAAVLGVSPYKTRREAWAELLAEYRPDDLTRLGIELPKREESAAVRWGNAFESGLLDYREGRSAANRQAQHYYDISPYVRLRATLDARLPSGEIVEIKTTYVQNWKERWGEPGSDRIPIEYQAQVQQQMLCVPCSTAMVHVLCWPARPEQWEQAGMVVGPSLPDNGRSPHVSRWIETLDEMGYLHSYCIAADPDAQQSIVDAVRDFSEKHLGDDPVPPPATAPDDVRMMFLEPNGTVIADKRIERLAIEYRDIGREIGKSGYLSQRRDRIKTEIMEYMRIQDRAIDDDSREKTVLVDSSGAKLAQFDGKTFR